MAHKRIRSLVTIWLLGFSIIGFAQSIPIMPSPLSIALTVGQWLLKNSKKVYYIQVESTATTEEQARRAGFKLAVTQAVGTLVISETEVKNKQLVRDEIIQYSSGYIDDFKVISNTQVGGMTRLVMDVWVVESKISDRILGESKADGTVDGARASLQQQTYLMEQYSGDQLINLVTRDFPRNAFDVKIRKTEITQEGRDSFINVYFNWEWNDDFLNALTEALKKTRQNNGIDTFFKRDNWGAVVEISPKDYWPLNEMVAAYSDAYKGKILYKNIIASKPQINLTLKDDANNILYSACHDHQSLWGIYYGRGGAGGLLEKGQFFAADAPHSNILISGNYSTSSAIKTGIGRNVEALGRLKNIEVKIVSRAECPR